MKKKNERCTCGACKENVFSLLNDHPHHLHLFVAQHHVEDLLFPVGCYTVEARSKPHRNLAREETVDGQLGLLRAAGIGKGTQ